MQLSDINKIRYGEITESTPSKFIENLERLAKTEINPHWSSSPQFYAAIEDQCIGVLVAGIWPTADGYYYRPDVVVHKNFRGGRIGLKLIDMALNYYAMEEQPNGVGLAITVINPKLFAYLKRQYPTLEEIEQTDDNKPVLGFRPINSEE